MTRSTMVRRSWAALISTTALLLASCGGSGGDNGTAQLRVLNATSDLTSIDMYLGDSVNTAAVNADSVSSYKSFDAQSYTVKITSAGNPTSLFSSTWSFSKDQHYTGVVWGRNGSLSFTTLPEDGTTTDISSNSSRVRVYNATTNSGALDVYLTQNLDDLSTASPTSANVGSNTLSGFKELTTGTYRLRVTSANSPNDVRLDTTVTLPSQEFATILVTAGSGGFLVNGYLVQQQGALTLLKNPKARLRLAAGVEGAAAVSVNFGSTLTIPALQSPFVGPYTLVDAGSPIVNVQVGGTDLDNGLGTRTLAPAGDYTILTYGTGTAATAALINDDNRLPNSGYYKIRLVNSSASNPLVTLMVAGGYVTDASNLAVGSGSPYTPYVATNTVTGTEIQVLSGSTTLPPLLSGQNPSPLGVYSIFVLGGDTSKVVRLSKDR